MANEGASKTFQMLAKAAAANQEDAEEDEGDEQEEEAEEKGIVHHVVVASMEHFDSVPVNDAVGLNDESSSSDPALNQS